MRKRNEYAIYHGDKFIDLGTKEYLAKKLNVTTKTIESYQTPSHQKRTGYKGYIVIRLEED